ncbi:serine hydrolase domain-containing protein [Tenacibaculum caenipelagi]|uniref:Putative secreted protein (Type I secretion substrate) n=1 Tax=Tenacibaculum caenipelagi TaxID=1325435 RepID=A0A4R6TGG1_9FLAO|nr:serine hydrolase domain-containing protein [Tenacibaculum caenipelagi]TDQ24042.1 putative secreted protein (type I secretion substrate) [Tenacibaculum caenipelagi]
MSCLYNLLPIMLRLNQKTLLFFFTVLLIKIGSAQSIDTQKLDTYFNSIEINNKFMGSVAILKKGNIIYTKQVGFSDIQSKHKPDNNTKYRIGSISKVFTATLLFKAIEEGKITLNETINSYFPEIKNANKITISNLLNHRSGIHSFTNNKNEFLSYHTQSKTEKEMITIITKGGSDFKPNEKAAYSNSNYLLLSYILEKLYKKPYAQILENEITKPLNLNQTFFGSKINIENNECYAYRFVDKWKQTEETDPSIDMGAGGIVSSPTDLVLFAKALFSHKILSAESVAQMKTIQDKFGMGIFKTEYYDKVSYGHNGEINGFTSVLRYFPNEDIAFAITSNGLNYNLNTITVTIVNSLFNKHFNIPDFRVYKPSSKELNQYLGIYSSKTFPVKLTVTKSGKQLHLQAPRDSKMNLQATAKGEFKYEPADISIVFNIGKNQMLITQGGKTSILDKE